MTVVRLPNAVLAGIVAVSVTACHKASAPQAVPDGQADAIRMYASQVDHVVLAKIFEERLERKPPPQKHLLHLRARVERSYKGSWREAEIVNVSTGRESVPAEFAGTDVVRDSGKLVVLFLTRHTEAEIFLDVGLLWSYQPQLEPVLEGIARQ
jgi:hypothetical protein